MSYKTPKTWTPCMENDILEAYSEVIDRAQTLGYIGSDIPPLYMFKSTKYWGKCITSYGDSFIGINVCMKGNIEAITETLIHEIAHAAFPRHHHDDVWKRAANDIGSWFGIKAKRCSSSEEKGVDMPTKELPNYILECEKCKQKWTYHRITKVVRTPEKYGCPICKVYGTIHRIKK